MTALDRNGLERALAALPAWVDPSRRTAMDHFEKLGMPSPKEEVWRYVELDFDLGDFSVAEKPGPPMSGDDVLGSSLGGTSAAVHLVDGTVHAVESSEGGGIVVESLSTALENRQGELAERYATGVPVDLDVFSAAHHAFHTDGVYVRVPRGQAPDRPVYIEIQAVTPDTASFPHLLVIVEDGAQASIVVNYRSPGTGRFLVVPQFEAFVGDNAVLDTTFVQNWGYRTSAVAQGRLVAGRDATVRLAEAGLGADLSRLHLFVDLLGRGSNAEILGAYFGEESQTLDYRYFMHHAGLNTRSDMFLKGAVEDDALSVFTGMIRIDEGAQKTNAFQTNRNLILSEGAAAQSVPNLEILANDVRCGHGSTVGPLDEEQRYYLMSRGLTGERADRLQVRGFFEEAISRFPQERVREPIRRWINDKFIAAQEAGRV